MWLEFCYREGKALWQQRLVMACLLGYSILLLSAAACLGLEQYSRWWWLLVLMSVLLSLEQPWRLEYQSGSLLQFVLQERPLLPLICSKLLASYCLLALPLLLGLLCAALWFPVAWQELALCALSLGCALPVLTVLGNILAVLTLGFARASLLLPLLFIPLCLPIIVLASKVPVLFSFGIAYQGALALLLAYSLLALCVGPYLLCQAVKISVLA
jgi:heme exporter protein B